jgi:hypothetical protein
MQCNISGQIAKIEAIEVEADKPHQGGGAHSVQYGATTQEQNVYIWYKKLNYQSATQHIFYWDNVKKPRVTERILQEILK